MKRGPYFTDVLKELNQSATHMVIDPQILQGHPDSLNERTKASSKEGDVGRAGMGVCCRECIAGALEVVGLSGIFFGGHGGWGSRGFWIHCDENASHQSRHTHTRHAWRVTTCRSPDRDGLLVVFAGFALWRAGSCLRTIDAWHRKNRSNTVDPIEHLG